MSETDGLIQSGAGSVVTNGTSATLNKQQQQQQQQQQHHQVSPSHGPLNSSPTSTNIFVRFIRSVFGYRKTTLTSFVVLSLLFTFLLSWYDNSLEYSVSLPTNKDEILILQQAWLDLQHIAKYEHTYGSKSNDYVHDYLENQILNVIKHKNYIEYDNDLNGTNNILFNTRSSSEFSSVSYYESNNLVVRINGSNEELPAFLLSAHYDAVPSSFGVTDDGMGIASLLGVLYYYSQSSTNQPERTIIFNFNNNEEFGLYGATSFLSHPWFKQIKYFLNLEGTGAGGKAILFRGTDYGILKYFKSVRYPYGTSIFQEGFNNHLIHSETDYKVYKEKGSIRGLDLAFFKPRDIYHTGSDNIKNVNIKSLWHMLANSLDFTETITNQQIDLDNEYLNNETSIYSHEFASYTSFLNYFFAFPISQILIVNVVTLLIIPIIEIPFFLIIFNYKKVWKVTFLNIIKFPLSIVASFFVVHGAVLKTIEYNEFLPNSGSELLLITYSSLFLLSNYIFLNLFNALNSYKVINHDEKLIVIWEISIVYAIVLIWSTIKLSNNEIGNDHTGEFPFLFLYILQAIGSIFGFIGWSLKSSKRPTIIEGTISESQPLLHNDEVNYGTDFHDGDIRISSTSSSLLNPEEDLFAGHETLKKFFSYDWSLQFLIIVPFSSLIIYNSGYLILEGIKKSIQESLAAEYLIYKFIVIFSIAWSIPFLPFVFKLNRIIVLALIAIVASGTFFVAVTNPFDQLNPLKLRFVQSIYLDQGLDSYVNVVGRKGTPIDDVLADIPSLKESHEVLNCTATTDGNQICSYKSTLSPNLIDGVTNYGELLEVEILKNSSSGSDHPFGYLVGEFKVKTKENRMCILNFNKGVTSSSQSSAYKDVPVKTVIVYNDKPKSNLSNSDINTKAIPEGFSTDSNGNYIYKDLAGINQIQLNKLSWDKDYHIGIQWVPNLAEDTSESKLSITAICYWADLAPLATDQGVLSSIPAYDELLHYTPNYVTFANYERGLVSITKSFQV
ncbi:putative zinc metalloprotease [Scheffersomyces amazonensis]|uniref:putative zinc metalloprotease n=1 Tax=Scheffersomyces amazonensis TaxID=1078765 RepID=UPI00315D09DA